MIFLAETANIDSWVSLVTKFYSYSRVAVNDGFLFRPLFFVFLVSEQTLFGYTHYFLYQITGVILHLIVVWHLLKLCLQIRPSLIAVLLTLFFSMLCISSEMVSWYHVNAYLVGMLCMIKVLHHSYVFDQEHYKNFRRLFWMIAYLTIASFISEIFMAASAFFVLYYVITLSVEKRRNHNAINPLWCLIFLIPIFLYFGLDYADKLVRLGPGYAKGWNSVVIVLEGFQLGNTLKMFLLASGLWIYAGLFPYLQDILPSDRLHWSTPASWNDFFQSFHINLLTVAGLLLLVLIGIGLLSVIISRKKTERLTKISWAILVLCLAFLVPLMLVVGRLNNMSVEYLKGSTYFTYIFWCLLSIAACAFSCFIHFSFLPKPFRMVLNGLLIICFLTITTANASRVYVNNALLKKRFEPRIEFTKKIDQFISAHAMEPGFSFQFLSRFRGDKFQPFLKDRFDKRDDEQLYYSDAIYARYTRQQKPKYLLTQSESEELVIFDPEHVSPNDLVPMASYKMCNLYRQNNTYYAKAIALGPLHKTEINQTESSKTFFQSLDLDEVKKWAEEETNRRWGT